MVAAVCVVGQISIDATRFPTAADPMTDGGLISNYNTCSTRRNLYHCNRCLHSGTLPMKLDGRQSPEGNYVKRKRVPSWLGGNKAEERFYVTLEYGADRPLLSASALNPNGVPHQPAECNPCSSLPDSSHFMLRKHASVSENPDGDGHDVTYAADTLPQRFVLFSD
jgi:hypothetical protein